MKVEGVSDDASRVAQHGSTHSAGVSEHANANHIPLMS